MGHSWLCCGWALRQAQSACCCLAARKPGEPAPAACEALSREPIYRARIGVFIKVRPPVHGLQSVVEESHPSPKPVPPSPAAWRSLFTGRKGGSGLSCHFLFSASASLSDTAVLLERGPLVCVVGPLWAKSGPTGQCHEATHTNTPSVSTFQMGICTW